MTEERFDWGRLVIGVALIAIFTAGIHAEIEAGKFVGLGHFAYALPFAIDAYVIAAVMTRLDVAPAFAVMGFSVGGGHFLIGMQKGIEYAAAAAAIGVLLTVVLWRVHTLMEKRKERRARQIAEAEAAARATRDAELAEQERLAQIQRDNAAHAARLEAERVEREQAARAAREQAERDRKETDARIARENREHSARLEAERDARRREADRERRETEASERERLARIEAERQERERARLAEERTAAEAKAVAEREAKERAAAEARAAKVNKPKPVKPEPATRLQAVPSPTAVREQAVKDWIAGAITQEEAAERAGVSVKTIQRDRDKFKPEAAAVNA